MRHLLAAAAIALALVAPARVNALNLLGTNTSVANQAAGLMIPAAGTYATQWTALPASPKRLVAQFNLVGPVGGMSVDIYLQTSLDGGQTAIDIMNFHATTLAERVAQAVNNVASVLTPLAATDGALAANTAVDGILGPLYRVKYVVVGTYSAGTIQLDVAGDEVGWQ